MGSIERRSCDLGDDSKLEMVDRESPIDGDASARKRLPRNTRKEVRDGVVR
jgi:hypothetical protein